MGEPPQYVPSVTTYGIDDYAGLRKHIEDHMKFVPAPWPLTIKRVLPFPIIGADSTGIYITTRKEKQTWQKQ